MTATQLPHQPSGPGDRGSGSGDGTADLAASDPASDPAADTGTSAKRRYPKLGPILPARFRPTNRPTLWIEIALVGISYYLYRVTQNAAGGGSVAPYHRGHDILRLEHTLHIDIEHWLNHTIAKISWLIVGMNYYYATLHFAVTIGVFVWVYVKFPDRYRSLRTVMFAMNLLGLIVYYLYAVAPPRLLEKDRFIDTFCVHHTWGQQTCDGVAGLSGTMTNQVAAMPSLHIGWAVWCALAIAHLAERKWVKVLGILYPVGTFLVIISKADHYVLDAVGGMIALGGGFLIQRVLQGRPVFSAAPPTGSVGVPRQGTATVSAPAAHLLPPAFNATSSKDVPPPM